MAEVSGKLGSVELSGSSGQITSWTLSYTGDALETTDFDDSTGGRSYIPGLTGWSGSFDAFYSTGNTNVACSTGSIVLRTTTGTAGLFAGGVIITGMDVGNPVDGIATQNYTFQGTGALSLTT